MSLIGKNMELALRDALSRHPLPDTISVPLCLGGPFELPLMTAVQSYAESLRSGNDEGILARDTEALRLVEQLVRTGALPSLGDRA